jgi:glycosyltransferase involved in cell wall biosynthesis
MIRVVYSADVFETQRRGGVSRYFVELATQLYYLGQIEPSFSTAVHINTHLKESLFGSGCYLPVSPPRIRASNTMRRLNHFYSKSLTSSRKFEIRHETFYQGGVNSLNAIKTVTTVYDLIREKSINNWHGFHNKQDSLSRADAIICISQTTKDDLQDYYQVDLNKVFVVPLGVSDIFKCDLETIQKRRKKNQLLYVGSREGYKDFNTLLYAFSYSKFLKENMEVLVFGSRFNKLEENLMESLGVKNNFRELSGDDKALASAYQDSLALISTSTYEGFGLTVLEAMMSGCVVISTRGGSLGEVAGNFDVYFEPSNPYSLIEAIEGVVSQDSNNLLLTLNAQEHAKSFTWEKTALQTTDVYKSLLS